MLLRAWCYPKCLKFTLTIPIGENCKFKGKLQLQGIMQLSVSRNGVLLLVSGQTFMKLYSAVQTYHELSYSSSFQQKNGQRCKSNFADLQLIHDISQIFKDRQTDQQINQHVILNMKQRKIMYKILMLGPFPKALLAQGTMTDTYQIHS